MLKALACQALFLIILRFLIKQHHTDYHQQGDHTGDNCMFTLPDHFVSLKKQAEHHCKYKNGDNDPMPCFHDNLRFRYKPELL